VLDAIFSHKAHDVPTNARVAWDTKWAEKPKGKPVREFFGNCNGETILKYYPKVFEVFGQQEASYVILDNASTHKKFKENLKDYDKDNLINWLTEKLSPGDFEYTPLTPEKHQAVHDFVHHYNNHPDYYTRKEVMNFIRENKIRTVALMELASFFGPGLIYLPPYWPELNAIEKLWARLKNEYRRTDPSKEWTERLAESYEKIDALFIRKIISDTIRFARKKLEEFEADKMAAANVAIGQDDDDDETDSDNEGNDEDLNAPEGYSESEDSESDDE